MDLSTIADIQKLYDKLDEQEEAVTKQIEAHVAKQYRLEARLRSVTKALPKLQEVGTDAAKLADMVHNTAVLAERVSDKVRRLDTTRSRVSECQQRVHDLMDIQSCSEGVSKALENKDYEKVAAHIHRFLTIDQSLVRQTADDVAEDTNSVNNTLHHLHEVTKNVNDLFTKKFDKAVKDKDFASVERFFKLYPLLNQHEKGIEKYSIHLSSKLQDTYQENLKAALSVVESEGSIKPNMVFADTLTLLLEGTARIIETHQALVDNYYGPEQLILLVKHLQVKCDELSKKTLDLFIKHRKLKGTVFLVTSADPTTKPKPEPRSLDVLLGEITLMSAKAHLYFHFIRKKLVGGPDSDINLKKSVENLINKCTLNQEITQLVKLDYAQLEKYFIEESFKKVQIIETLDSDALVTSLVDDMFFIIRKSVRRACSSRNIQTILHILMEVSSFLKRKYSKFLKEKLKRSWPDMDDVLQPVPDTKHNEITFLTYLNNADVSIEYTETLKNSIKDDLLHTFPNMSSTNLEQFTTSLIDLSNVNQLSDLVNNGMKQLRKLISSKLEPWVTKLGKVDHKPRDSQVEVYNENMTCVHELISNTDQLLTFFKAALTRTNYDILVNEFTSEITKQLENIIFKTRFNRLGGLLLDKEMRALIGYLTSTTSWSVRDMFGRLIQISALLNLECASEISDWIHSTGRLDIKLDKKEIRKVLELRFSLIEIQEIRNLDQLLQ